MQTFGRVMGSVRPPNLCLFLNYLLHFTPSTNKQNVLQEMPIVGRNVKHSVDSSKWIFCYPLFLFSSESYILYFQIWIFYIQCLTFHLSIFDIRYSSSVFNSGSASPVAKSGACQYEETLMGKIL